MTATVIDGRQIASEIQQEVSQTIKSLNLKPHLVVILASEDPASEVYIKRKQKVCEEVGISTELYVFNSSESQCYIEKFIDALNTNPFVDGILIQLPLFPHLDKNRILNSVSPDKDVDCFNAVNIGKMAQGIGAFRPCTPAGICEILKYHKIPTEGRRITIINRSLVVGCPLALMLQQDPYNATVTVCHEHTTNLAFHTLNSEIVITAVGKHPKFRLPEFYLPYNGTAIDVAMNRIDGKLFGDIVDFEFEAAKERVRWITPVPGGIGPMTVAMLMKNTLTAAKLKMNLYREVG